MRQMFRPPNPPTNSLLVRSYPIIPVMNVAAYHHIHLTSSNVIYPQAVNSHQLAPIFHSQLRRAHMSAERVDTLTEGLVALSQRKPQRFSKAFFCEILGNCGITLGHSQVLKRNCWLTSLTPHFPTNISEYPNTSLGPG